MKNKYYRLIEEYRTFSYGMVGLRDVDPDFAHGIVKGVRPFIIYTRLMYDQDCYLRLGKE